MSDSKLLAACRYNFLHRLINRFGFKIGLGLSISMGIGLAALLFFALSKEFQFFDPNREQSIGFVKIFMTIGFVLFGFCVGFGITGIAIIWLFSLVFDRIDLLQTEAKKRFTHKIARCDPLTIERLTAKSGPHDWFVGVYRYEYSGTEIQHLEPINTIAIGINDQEGGPTAAVHLWTYPESIDFGETKAQQMITHTCRSIDHDSIDQLQSALNRVPNQPLINDDREDFDGVFYILRVINPDLDLHQLAECTLPAWWADVEVDINKVPISSVLVNRVLRIARDLNQSDINQSANVAGGT